MLIPFTIMIPFLLALTFSILLTLVFVIPAIFLFLRWGEMLGSEDSENFNIDDMKVPTFYSKKNDDGVPMGFIFPVVGAIFGGIHCVGWFFNFPSRVEAMLWQVSSAVLTGSAVLLPIVGFFLGLQFESFGFPLLSIIFLVYVVSRLLLLVEAFISLRDLTPGMLALVKWTSFIPHI